MTLCRDLDGVWVGADNTGVFRDIKKRGKRKVLELDPAGRKIVEVRSRRVHL